MRYFIGLALAAAAAHSLIAQENWYEMQLGGQPAGYAYSSVALQASQGAVITEEMRFVMNRLGTRIEVKSRSRTLDDPGGKVTSIQGETSSSQQVTSYEGFVSGLGIELRTTTGGRSYTQTIPTGEAVVSSRGVAALCRERLKKVNDSVTYFQFVPDFARAAKFTRTLIEDSATNGKRLLKVEEANDLMAGARTIWLNPDFTMVSSFFDLPFGKLYLRETDRETALRAISGAELKGESYAQTLARSNIRLPDPRSIGRLRIRLTHRRPELGWPSFKSGNQRILEQTRDTVVLEVWRPAVRRSLIKIDEAQFLRPNAVLQSDDTEVVRLAASLKPTERASRLQTARRMQTWVADNLKLDLGIALAPASEVARNRAGTCISYAVLLASLARAAHIPSRVAVGYVYTSGIWGGHAWIEVLHDGQWLPLDAAAWSPGVADAARFQFGSYTMEDNMAAATVAGSKLYGNIDVAVLEYVIRGKRVRVSPSPEPYRVSQTGYANRWLGFSFQVPEGFRFDRLDAVYPDMTVVSAERQNTLLTVGLRPLRSNARIDPSSLPLKTKLGTRPARASVGHSSRRIVAADGNSLWTITAEGPGAASLMKVVIKNWKWLPLR